VEKVKLLSCHQVYTLKRKTLEKRIKNYYYQTRDEQDTIQFLIALQVRDELGKEDFSFVLRDLVRKIFLESKPTRALRSYYIFFKDYFTLKEWRVLSIRLFPVKTFAKEKIEKLYMRFFKMPLKGLVGS
jgi:hypothetical protein